MATKLELEAISVMDRLQSWLEEIGYKATDQFDGPHASLQLCGNGVASISIGDICVWCSESHSSECMTFEACRDEFLKEIEQYEPYLQVERSGS